MFQRFINNIRKIRHQKAAILMYHQVCQKADDPWELAVHPNHFHAQLEYLRKNFEVVPMTELAEGVVHHKMKKVIAITFDDGFRDNYTNAAPLLDWLEIPATFYVGTTAVLDEKIYWWDALQDIIFHSEVLPPCFGMVINGEFVKFSFQSDHTLNNRLKNQIRVWNCNLPIPNERIALYMFLWCRLKPLSNAQQSTALDTIKNWAGRDISCPHGVTMNLREVRMLSQNPLFRIGAHAVHHAMLPEQNPIDQAYEVKESKRQIEKWLDKPVDGFAYPYGNYNFITQRLLKEAGFTYAVSTESKPVTLEDDPFALPRIQVKNWNVYEFASKINEMIHE